MNDGKALDAIPARALRLIECRVRARQGLADPVVACPYLRKATTTAPIDHASKGGNSVHLLPRREQALGYIATIFENFSQVKLVERATYVADDGKTAFVEAKGDLIQRNTDASYRNVYVFKLSMQDGCISHVREYANPVTFAKLMGIPLG